MRTFKFPKMFNSNNTRVWLPEEHKQATGQNIKLLLNTVRGELLGDPYVGVTIKNLMFNPNSPVLHDILADIIYNQIALFIPQLKVRREDISVYSDKKGSVICLFSGTDQIDYSIVTYSLVLLDSTKN